MEWLPAAAPPATAALPVTPASLLASSAAVPDPRRQASVTYYGSRAAWGPASASRSPGRG